MKYTGIYNKDEMINIIINEKLCVAASNKRCMSIN